MAIESPNELFVLLLSDVREGTEHTTQMFQNFSRITQNAEVKEALDARIFLSQRAVEKLDECFRLVGERPVKLGGRLHEVFDEDFRKELAEIESPIAKQIYVLAKASQWIHLRIGEYEALIVVAKMTGHCGIRVLLESCLVDNIAFAERARRLIRNIVKGRSQ